MNRPLFKNENAFYAILTGQLFSTVGSSMTRFGLGIWVLAQTGDIASYTVLLFFAVVPVGLGSLFAGPLVDRWDRRWTLIIGNAVASLSTLIVAILFFSDQLQIWHLYITLSINGLANSFVLPAFEASTPMLVNKKLLPRAAGLTQLVQAMEVTLGPALGGFLIGFFDLGLLFIIDFVTFGISIVALLLSIIPQPTADKSGAGSQSVWHSFTFGLQYIYQRPSFLYLMGLVTVSMFFVSGFGYALSTPLVLTFSGEEAAGLVISAFGVGAIVASLLLVSWGGPKRRMDGILIALLLSGIFSILIGVRENTPMIATGMFGIGVAFIFLLGLNRVIWQVKAAPDVLGRIFALRVSLGVGAQSLGIFLAGPLADNIFEPLLAEGGALASSVGQFIGVGPGRGIALMYILLGLILLVIAAVSAATPAVRFMEDRIPDFEPAPEPLEPAPVGQLTPEPAGD